MLPITLLRLFCLSPTTMEKFTPWLSTPALFLPPNSTTTSMTKNFLQYSKLSESGVIILREAVFRLMLSQITRIWSIFLPPNSSLVDKHVGLNTSPRSNSSSDSVPANSEQSLTLSLDDGTSTQKREIVATPKLTHTTSNLFSQKNS